MNNYIIDPQVFYWINAFAALKVVLGLLGGLATLSAIVLIVMYIFELYDLGKNIPDETPKDCTTWEKDRYDRQMKEYNNILKSVQLIRKWMIISICVAAITILAAIFIPSKSTSIEMMVAKTATYDNVNWTAQQVKEVIDYIVSALKGAT